MMLSFSEHHVCATVWSVFCVHPSMVRVLCPSFNGPCFVSILQWSVFCVHLSMVRVLCPSFNGPCFVSILQWSMFCVHPSMDHVLCPSFNGPCFVSILQWSVFCVHPSISKHAFVYSQISLLKDSRLFRAKSVKSLIELFVKITPCHI